MGLFLDDLLIMDITKAKDVGQGNSDVSDSGSFEDKEVRNNGGTSSKVHSGDQRDVHNATSINDRVVDSEPSTGNDMSGAEEESDSELYELYDFQDEQLWVELNSYSTVMSKQLDWFDPFNNYIEYKSSPLTLIEIGNGLEISSSK